MATTGVCVFVRGFGCALFVFGGIMRRVDKLGRIVIPLELREKYGLTEGAEIEFSDTCDGVTVKLSEPFCRLCKGKISEESDLPICKDCIDKVIKSYNSGKNRI